MAVTSDCIIIPVSGHFPNNTILPAVIYHEVTDSTLNSPPSFFEQLFESHGWTGSWRNGIYPFHHYHSSAHEALGVFSGCARVILGGDEGPEFDLKVGDVVVIPAGVAHKKLSASSEFAVVGAYPAGTSPDMCYGKEEELQQALSRIKTLPIPKEDPVNGCEGIIISKWGGQ